MQSFQPVSVYLTAGFGHGSAELTAFDTALRDAGISDFNLVEISSIVPPGAKVETLDLEGSISGRGRLLPTVYEEIHDSEPDTEISAGIIAGIPEEKNKPGVIFGDASTGTVENVTENLETMLEEGMKNRGCHSYTQKLETASTHVRAPVSSTVAAAVICDEETEDLIAGAQDN